MHVGHLPISLAYYEGGHYGGIHRSSTTVFNVDNDSKNGKETESRAMAYVSILLK